MIEFRKMVITQNGKWIGFGMDEEGSYDEYEWEDYIVRIYDNSILYLDMRLNNISK